MSVNDIHQPRPARASSRTVQLGADSVPHDQWRHFHKITPLSQAGALWFVLILVLYNMVSEAVEQGGISGIVNLLKDARSVALPIIGAVVGAFLLITFLVMLFSFISWKKKTFAVVESGIHLRSGVFIKQHTQMRWDRVQSVEIQQKLLGRIFGFGTVKVESAGNDEDLALGLLTMRDAAALRAELLGVVNRVRSGTTSVTSPNMAGSTAPELGRSELGQPLILDVDDLERDQLVYELPLGRLVLSRLCSANTILVLCLIVPVFIVGVIVGMLEEGSQGVAWSLSGSLAVLVGMAGMIWGLIRGCFDDYGTKIYISANGVRKRSGLTKLTTSTYPPQRIHAISISQPWLWKKIGWWKICITKAGALGSAKNSSASEAAADLAGVLVPAATREEMLRMLWVLIPGLGTDNDAALLEEAFEGRSSGVWFIGSPRSARILSPIDWAYHGLALTKRAMIIRKKRFGREVQIILQDHTQSLQLSQGPLARRCKVAHLRAHLVAGSVGAKASALVAEKAWELLLQENQLARQARAVRVTESLAEWKARVGVSEADTDTVVSAEQSGADEQGSPDEQSGVDEQGSPDELGGAA